MKGETRVILLAVLIYVCAAKITVKPIPMQGDNKVKGDPEQCTCEHKETCSCVVDKSSIFGDYGNSWILFPNVSAHIKGQGGYLHFYLGPDPQHYWSGCCSGDDCEWAGDNMYYGGGCGLSSGYLSIYNHNVIESKVTVITTTVGESDVSCALAGAEEWCPV
eukprot:CAMPEP_0174255396 /NCGR_PEP_ID=MMETSP0439-20130205/4724_1 /TAXON_ID=0 /ORGANISM="Stereomyxa ramosa, Strain Chinc5" /LENGTH=161 /DNA_ID=CAMNT_0015337555 /DNA_START=16 /DNA_END=501 /DNA_ORIENTATION=-